MKVGDLVKLRRGYTSPPGVRRAADATSPPGVVIKVKPTSTGDWIFIAWLDELWTWHNFRDLEVVSG